MDRNQAKELLPIIQAYAEGKTILVKDKRLSDEEDNWNEANDCSFDIEKIDYRIKPESTYRPFEDAEECWNEMFKHQPFGWLTCVGCRYNIVSVSNIDVSMANVSGDIVTLRFCEVMESDTFADGTPFGVKVEEQYGMGMC